MPLIYEAILAILAIIGIFGTIIFTLLAIYTALIGSFGYMAACLIMAYLFRQFTNAIP